MKDNIIESTDKEEPFIILAVDNKDEENKITETELESTAYHAMTDQSFKDTLTLTAENTSSAL